MDLLEWLGKWGGLVAISGYIFCMLYFIHWHRKVVRDIYFTGGTIKGREEGGSAKVCAARTALCHCCGTSLAHALGEASALASKHPLLQADVSERLVRRWKKAIERDQALIEAARQRRETLLTRHLVVREKVQALLCSLAAWQDDQGLLADLDTIEVAIRGIFGEPCSQHDK